MANVIFKQGTRAQYDAIAVKDSHTLYWLTDTLELFKGDVFYGKGAEATTLASGLMSAADKAKLDMLASGGAAGLTAVDASVILGVGEGGTTIGVQVSKEEGNALALKDDGLFVSSPAEAVEFVIERQADTEGGFAATYKLKRIAGAEETYIGDEINIPKDLVLQSGSLETVAETNQPYIGAEAGDPYIDLVLNDTDSTHIYIPVKGIVGNSYTAGVGVKVENGAISLKLSETSANGLAVGDDGLSLGTATTTTAGAMSAEDKTALDSAVGDIETIMASIVWSDLGASETA